MIASPHPRGVARPRRSRIELRCPGRQRPQRGAARHLGRAARHRSPTPPTMAMYCRRDPVQVQGRLRPHTEKGRRPRRAAVGRPVLFGVMLIVGGDGGIGLRGSAMRINTDRPSPAAGLGDLGGDGGAGLHRICGGAGRRLSASSLFTILIPKSCTNGGESRTPERTGTSVTETCVFFYSPTCLSAQYIASLSWCSRS